MGDKFVKCVCTIRMKLAITGAIYLLFRTGVSIFDTIAGPYLLRIVCEKRFNENKTVCDQIQLHPDLENEVQEYAGFYFILYRLIMNIPVIFSGLFCGAWSDKKGRMVPMICPSVGTILAAMVFIVSLYMGSVAVWIFLFGTLIQSVFGNTPVFAMAVNSYIAEVSDNAQRTKLISMLYAMSSFGQSLGAFFAGILEWKLLLSYEIVIGIHCVTALMIIIFLQCTEDKNKDKYIEHTSETEPKSFTCSNLLDGLRSYKALLVENGTNSLRIIVVIQLCLTFFYGCDLNGVDDVFLMYVTAIPFNWSKSWYSYYVSMRNISTGFIFLVVLPILINLLKLSDCTMIVIGLLCNIFRYIGTGLSNKSWMIYALLTVWSISLIIRPCIWSILSKAVNEYELGKMFTLYTITDTLAKCVGSAVYVNLYGATVAFSPEITFYVMASVNIIILVFGFTMNKCIGKADDLSLIESETNTQVTSDVNEWDKDEDKIIQNGSILSCPEKSKKNSKMLLDTDQCSKNASTIPTVPTERSNLYDSSDSTKLQYS